MKALFAFICPLYSYQVWAIWTNMKEASVAHGGIGSIWVKGLFASSCHLFPFMCGFSNESLFGWIVSLMQHMGLRWMWSLIARLVGLLNYTVCWLGHVHNGQCLCVCVCVRERERERECAHVCVKCAAAKTDRTQAHISLPRKRYKATHTGLVSSLSHPHTLSFQLCIFELFLSQTVYTHTHTCSPHPAKRKRWLVNKQWHSAHSVTRLSFDQHRRFCSPQQCFLSFCLPNAVVHAHT